MIEIWKPVVGYEGKYEVSSLGNVRSLNYHNQKMIRLLKPRISNNYLRLCLCNDGDEKSFFVHLLVANAFIPNPNNFPQVNHKDENPLNNNVDNLEWCNQKYNNVYGTRIKRVSEKTTNGKLSKVVLQYDLEGNFIAEFPSVAEVERQLGFFASNVGCCCRGKQKTSYGYIWKYK